MLKFEMPKAYEAKEYEGLIYKDWERSGFFNPDRLPGERKRVFSIVLPPPNVTGTLHMGHAVMLAIEDIMVRFHRMRGHKTLWVPGVDHAAIATQTKVEKLLMAQGMRDPRRELGREAFLKHVEQFAAESHDTIINQAKKMGASLDWSREAYTLDEPRSRAVNTVFKTMYEDGLIYRDYRLVNWCSRCKSTLADDEVEYREEKSKFYYFKYGPVVIGTARPETKFLDKVIIVHPDDPRYQKLIGKEFEVEWIEGRVKAKVVADPIAEMDLGSGAMTITPAHSFVDFDLAKKHGFEIAQIIGEDGRLTQAAGSFAGRDARESRETIVQQLSEKGLVDHIDEDYMHNLSVCYRCGSPVEPLPKLQWFINVNKPFAFRANPRHPIAGIRNGQALTLKELMTHVVRSGQIRIIPERFVKTYFHWIDNLRDWNISRQIWFGHRVPVWYCKGGVGGKCLNDCRQPIVSIEPPKECPACHSSKLEQDPDTLDTWFSSSLWTFSTLGWPGDTQDVRAFHPTSVLETGYDILFFWVARMILMSGYVLGEVPFTSVYLHGLVRDEQGRKMSKSLDNIIDPLDMIDLYGADATRLSLVIGSTPGNDMKLSKAKVAGFRNFTNKLWNISRFVLMKVDRVRQVRVSELQPQTLADRWILSCFSTVLREVTDHLEAYEFSQAGEKLRDFTWSQFADWYLEVAKWQKSDQTDRILLHILENLLTLWHPFMPFVTEQIWRCMDFKEKLLIHEWPTVAQDHLDPDAEKQFAEVQELIAAIRNIRSQYRVAPKQKIHICIVPPLLEADEGIVQMLACVEEVVHQPPTGDYVSVVVGERQVFISLRGLVDFQVERAKQQEQEKETLNYISTLHAKLADTQFISKAPERVVLNMKKNLAEAEKRLELIRHQLHSNS